MKKLLLIIGIPGTGKSTLANKFKSEDPEFANANIWEADMFFMKDGKYKFNHSILGAAHFWCQKSVENDMRVGKNVIVSNTSLTPLKTGTTSLLDMFFCEPSGIVHNQMSVLIFRKPQMAGLFLFWITSPVFVI